MSDTNRGRTRRAPVRAAALLLTPLVVAGGLTLAAPAAIAAAADRGNHDRCRTHGDGGRDGRGDGVCRGLTDLYAYSLVFSYDPKLLKFDANSSTGPDGGFFVESGGDGTVILTDTRLGSSPGLAGDLELGGFSFTAIGGGTADITISSATSRQLHLRDDGAVGRRPGIRGSHRPPRQAARCIEGR